MDTRELLEGQTPKTFRIDTIERPYTGNGWKTTLTHNSCQYTWYPSRAMQRLISKAWDWNPHPDLILGKGTSPQDWIGRRVRLRWDPNVAIVGKVTGGTRIVCLSHIEDPVTISRIHGDDETDLPEYTATPIP